MPTSAKLQAFRWVMSDPRARRLVLTHLAFVIVETMTWSAILTYAFSRGGATEVGIVGAAILVPGMVVAPLASFCGDRFDRIAVLGGSHLLVAASCLAVSVAMWMGMASITVYFAASVSAGVLTFPRPALGAVLPSAVASGDKLTAANVCVGIAQGVGLFLGPGSSALLLTFGSFDTVYLVGSVIAAICSVAVLTIKIVRRFDHDQMTIGVSDVHRETLAGIKLLCEQPRPRLVVLLLGLSVAMLGALDVTAVVMALEVLEMGDSGAGLLGAFIGLGGVIGAASGVAMIGRRRLAPLCIAVGFAQGLPLLVIAWWQRDFGVAAVVLLVAGCGISAAEVAGQTLLQRTTPDDVMARVFGCLEGFRMLSYAAGSLASSLLIGRLGPGGGLVAVAIGCVILVMACAPQLLSLDRDRPQPNDDLVELLRNSAIFAPLPVYSLEQVMSKLEPRPSVAGTPVVVQGCVGDTLFIVADGTADVVRDGTTVHVCARGDVFGEVAVLFDEPRNASVVARSDLLVFELGRDAFLEAVTGHPRALQRAQSTATGRRQQ